MEKTNKFVVRNAQGQFLALDRTSGNHPWWCDRFGTAELFEATESALHLIDGVRMREPIECQELYLGDPVSSTVIETEAYESIRARAIARLSDVEKRALGLSTQ